MSSDRSRHSSTRPSRALLLLAALAFATGCPKDPLTAAYVLRHAEKAAAPPADPPLTAEGQAHAEALAEQLGDQPIAAVFSTDTTRTRQTAEPLASRLGLTVQIYGTPDEVARLVRSDYAGKAVVIVGHSNTVPQIISELGATPPADIAAGIPEDEFDHLYLMLVGPDGAAVTALTY